MSSVWWKVSLRLVSDELSVAEISEMLGGEPDQSSDRGTFRPGSTLPRKFSFWEIHSDLPGESDVEDHVDRIIERMPVSFDDVRRVRPSLTFCVLAITGYFLRKDVGKPGVNLTERQLSLLAHAVASIDIELVPTRPEHLPS
jgi:hypothetical protein